MQRSFGLAGIVTALATAACGSSSSSSPSAAAAPQTLNVQVDGKTDAFNGAFYAYFPNDLTVHPGDTVSFTSVFRGEPHTVTLGSLVTEGLDAYDAKAKTAPNPQDVDESSVPQLAKIPQLVPNGPGDANQATAQPCFLEAGVDPPGPGPTACPKKDPQPEFTGTESLYNSGFLPDQKVFTVKLASSLKPATYRWFCALHREQMEGKLTVVAPTSPATSPDQAKKDADAQLQKRVDALTPVVTQANQNVQPGKVTAGVGSQDVQDALGAVFAPKDVSVPVGGSVTWGIFGPHTISFNSTAEDTPVVSTAPDGSVHINPKAAAPVGNRGVPPPGPPGGAPGASPGASPGTSSPGASRLASPAALTDTSSPSASAGASPAGSPGAPPGGPGSGPPPIKNVVDLGSFNGTGYWNTGLILSFPPNLTGVKVRFTKAGTYQYKCLIHTDMDGTVKVGAG